MLNNSDRQRFDEIRSRWEAAQPVDDKPSRMVGRKEKPVAHQPLGDDENGGASKFRRKLSHGLSFISNPLAQRRTTPIRHVTGRPSLPAHGPGMILDTGESDNLLTSIPDFASGDGSPMQRPTPANKSSPAKTLDPDATPKAIPRSRTMSFIPRPRRSGSDLSVVESDAVTTSRPPVYTLEHEARATPSKIPSPSPPIPGRRRSSPRQYIQNLTSQQEKYVAAGNALAAAGTQSSPSKASIRSYTTPNLVSGPRSPQRTRFMAPRKQTAQRSSGTLYGGLVPHKQHLKENIAPPTDRDSKRLAKVQEKSPRRQTLAAPSAVSKSKRRSLHLNNARPQSKREASATPTITNTIRTSQFGTQTPLADQRALPKKQTPVLLLAQAPNANGVAIAQPRLMGPVSPPTPPMIDPVAARPSVPRASTDKVFRRRTFTTPAKHSGAGILSRSQVGANHEVSLPRSSTFHSFVRDREPPPPMPPIPEQFKSPSMPILASEERTSPKSPGKPRSQRVLHADKSVYLKRKTEAIGGHDSGDIFGQFSYKGSNTSDLRWMRDQPARHGPGARVRDKPSDGDMTASQVQIAIGRPSSNPFLPLSLATRREQTDPPRPWSTQDQYSDDFADVHYALQVRECMPALYWAGRFQSRYDQWRTEALKAELQPGYTALGPLGQCKLSQDKVAACYIFLQLRDLCASNQAADSLWEFEYQYRQDHNMLGATFDLPPVKTRKQDEATPKSGPFSRAVRKLTPRKSSFVNLLKGKGWNTEEDLKVADTTSDHDGPSTKRRKSSEEDP